MTHTLMGRQGLLEILSWARPHDSSIERAFCREFLDTIPGMLADGFGNRSLAIGDDPSVLWSCHVDTVASRAGPQEVILDNHGVARLRSGKAGMSLGADDGAGIWIMLGMIVARRPGLYVFHRGEEEGCLGSAWIRRHRPEFLRDIDAAIAFDRAGFKDVITHQALGRTCSDAFAADLAGALNGAEKTFRYRPDNTGVFTDTNEYAGLVSECTNLSVGYHGQHGPRETLDVGHCEKLLAAMLRIDASTLAIARDPSAIVNDRWDFIGGYPGELEDFADAAARSPLTAARILMECGVTLDEFEYAMREDQRTSPAGLRAPTAR